MMLRETQSEISLADVTLQVRDETSQNISLTKQFPWVCSLHKKSDSLQARPQGKWKTCVTKLPFGKWHGQVSKMSHLTFALGIIDITRFISVKEYHALSPGISEKEHIGNASNDIHAIDSIHLMYIYIYKLENIQRHRIEPFSLEQHTHQFSLPPNSTVDSYSLPGPVPQCQEYAYEWLRGFQALRSHHADRTLTNCLPG